MTRYEIHPIASDKLDALHADVLATAETEHEAKRLAGLHSNCAFGSGILDTQTGEIDVGFGFGVPCPDFSGDAD